MGNQNCHARSKQKRKKLRLKNLLLRIFTRRKKALEPKRPKGRTLIDTPAWMVARKVHFSTTNGYDHQHCMRLNQRQKRKRQRQSCS